MLAAVAIGAPSAKNWEFWSISVQMTSVRRAPGPIFENGWIFLNFLKKLKIHIVSGASFFYGRYQTLT